MWLISSKSRFDLRDILIDSLRPGTIQWNHGVKSCRAVDDSTYEVTFLDENLSSITTSILIGADGTFSRVRPLLHNTLPSYAGIIMYDLTVPASNMTPTLREFVGAGGLMILEDGRCVMPQSNGRGKCKVYAGLRVPEDWLEEHPLPETGKREYVNSFYPGWCEGLVEQIVMAATEEDVTVRKIFEYDPKFRWSTDLTGVTIIGKPRNLVS